MANHKMIGPGGVPRPHRPMKEAAKRKIGAAVKAAVANRKQRAAVEPSGIQWEGREYGVLAAIRSQNERATVEASALMREALDKGWAWEDDADLYAAMFRACGGVTWEHGDTDTTGKGGV
jgi:hypothetical protein